MRYTHFVITKEKRPVDELEFMRAYSAILQREKVPLVCVDATQPNVVVPRQFVEGDGTIVLDVSARAVRNLRVEDDIVYCLASFNREIFHLSFPLASVLAIYEDEDFF